MAIKTLKNFFLSQRKCKKLPNSTLDTPGVAECVKKWKGTTLLYHRKSGWGFIFSQNSGVAQVPLRPP